MKTMNKTVKKIVSLLFCLILIVTQAAAVAENGNSSRTTFHITLHQNIMFSQYGVTVYIDGEKVAHLDQGDSITFNANAADGRDHKLIFVPDDSSVPNRVWNIGTFESGSTLKCEIQSKWDQVKIRSYNLSVNGETVCSAKPDTAEQFEMWTSIFMTWIELTEDAE